jgi:hypothetical protein
LERLRFVSSKSVAALLLQDHVHPIDQLPGDRYVWADMLEQLFGNDEELTRSYANRVLRHEGGDAFPDSIFGTILELRADQVLLDYDKADFPRGDCGPRLRLSLTALPHSHYPQVAVEISIAPGEPQGQQLFACVLAELSFELDEVPPYCEVDGVRLPCIIALAILALRMAGDEHTADALSARHLQRR